MKRNGFGRFAIPGRVMLPAAVALALLTATAALAGIFTAQAQNDAPKVANVEIISWPASGTSYGAGENIDVKVTFDQDVQLQFADDSQRPRLKLSIGAIQNRTARNVAYVQDQGEVAELYFRYVVTADDHENYGISIIPKFGRDGLINPLSVPDGGRVYAAGADAPVDADLRLREHVVTLAYGHRVNAATPEPPANLRAEQRGAGIHLKWEQPGSIQPDYYYIERRFHGDPPAGEYDGVILQRTKSGHFLRFYDQRWLYNGATYEYRVQGFQNNRHHSRISEPTTIEFTWAEPCDAKNPKPRVRNGCLTKPTPPPPPISARTPTPAPSAAPQITDATHNSVTIDWSRLIDDDGSFQVSATADGFHISRRAGSEVNFTNIVELPLSRTSYQDTGLSPETTYTWRLYEDHPQQRYNLMGEVTHTTLPDPAATPPPAPTPDNANGNASITGPATSAGGAAGAN